MSKLIAALGIILTIGTGGADAAPGCDDFKAALSEGAAKYQIPNPTFELAQDNKADSDITVWNIATFKELPTMMICSHGSVSTFAVYANDSDFTSSLHLSGIVLHGYGLEWREALELRDELVRAAKTRLTANIRMQDGSDASFIISVAGVPSFQIDAERR
jgi:hypothetical protein